MERSSLLGTDLLSPRVIDQEHRHPFQPNLKVRQSSTLYGEVPLARRSTSSPNAVKVSIPCSSADLGGETGRRMFGPSEDVRALRLERERVQQIHPAVGTWVEHECVE